jgi:hypothetical protein
MTDTCAKPTKECPFDSDTIKAFGAMQSKVTEMHTILVNGNGLIGRVRDLEAEMNQRKGSNRMLKLMLVVVGAIPIAIEVLRALKEIP